MVLAINETTAREKIVEVFPELIDAIQTNKTSQEFVDCLIAITRQLASQAEIFENEMTALVEAPRGGTVPTKVVKADDPRFADAVVITANVGSTAIEGSKMPDGFSTADHYVIPDGILATGGTMKGIIEEILQRHEEDGLPMPRFTLLHPIISKIGSESKSNILDWARNLGIDLNILYAHEEENGGYVEFAAEGASFADKGLLIVGALGIIDGQLSAEIGDYGDMLTEAERLNLIPENYK